MVQRDVWSLSLGRWLGVQVRLHMFFLLFATFTFFLAWRQPSVAGLPALATVCLLVLFFSVLLHEAAHCFVALRLGGAVDSVVLGPLGGLRAIRVTQDPQSELLAVLAGPLASLMVCLSCLSVVALYDNQAAYSLLNPLLPGNIFGDAIGPGGLTGGTLLRLTCWINLWLTVLNLIPAYPFDGGRAVQAFLQSIRPQIDREHALAIAATCARLVAVGLIVLALLFHDSMTSSQIPIWLPLVLLAIFVFFGTRVEESHLEQSQLDESMFGYDFSQGYTSLEREETESPKRREGAFARWLREREELRETRRREVERDEDCRMDEILRRLHSEGIDNLTHEERSLLKRVSARFRQRESH